MFAELAAGLTFPDYFVLAAFLAGMLVMGVVIARKQQSSDDFFVAGRNMPAWAVGISLFASLLSTITYLGMPGEMFRTGVAFLTRQLPIPLVLAVVWGLWIPFFMRLRLTSAYEYLERRFNYPVRAFAAVFCLLLLFGWISVVVLTASRAMAEITVPAIADPVARAETLNRMMFGIIIGVGLFSVLYTTLGGIRAVVWTDVIQFTVLLVGAVVTMMSIASMTGTGISDWITASQAYQHEEVQWFDWSVSNRSTVFTITVNMFFWFICTHGANQVALQRYFTVKDASAARRTYLVSAVASILIGVLLAGVGIALMSFLQMSDLPVKEELLNSQVGARGDLPDQVFPQFIRMYLPAGMKGLVVAALFAAAMSTIDSGANSASTIITVDFIRPFSKTPASSTKELQRARKLTAAAGVTVVLYTMLLYQISKGTNIIDLTQKGFNCFLGALGGLFVLGMFSRRVTASIALIALLVGEVFGVVTSYFREITSWLANTQGGWWAENLGGKSIEIAGILNYEGTPFSTHLVVPGAWVVTVVVGITLAFIFRTNCTETQSNWTWKKVVHGHQDETR
ncbi:sodium:solute symporter family transporter [Thalassoroseus pseudoceratinae]|uniref:sodium:solute symporter family transporter n=1 Tax=Thalassoroseus pseudoceratinae TaxID=2713176 RepID=UPI001420D69A|nr:sodium/solute symporter [Thalassoroseus pseudoceratinae]